MRRNLERSSSELILLAHACLGTRYIDICCLGGRIRGAAKAGNGSCSDSTWFDTGLDFSCARNDRGACCSRGRSFLGSSCESGIASISAFRFTYLATFFEILVLALYHTRRLLMDVLGSSRWSNNRRSVEIHWIHQIVSPKYAFMSLSRLMHMIAKLQGWFVD